MIAYRHGQDFGIVRNRSAQVLGQDGGDAFTGVMDRGRDQVGRPFSGKLNDEVAVIGFRDFQASFFQGWVEVDFWDRCRIFSCF